MAVGIGLVFGVLRLVNFAYGQLIMAGAFALAFGSQWGFPNWDSILFCFGVVLAFSATDGLARLPAPARTLAGGDARGDVRGRFPPAEHRAPRLRLVREERGSAGDISTRPSDIGGVFIKKIAVISVVTAAGCLAVILQLLLTRTPLGLHMRAAAMDFRTARMLGVRANRVIIGSRDHLRTPVRGRVRCDAERPGAHSRHERSPPRTRSRARRRRARRPNPPVAATLGGFSIGFANGLLGGVLPAEPEPVPAEPPLRAGDHRPACPSDGLFTRGDRAVERV